MKQKPVTIVLQIKPLSIMSRHCRIADEVVGTYIPLTHKRIPSLSKIILLRTQSSMYEVEGAQELVVGIVTSFLTTIELWCGISWPTLRFDRT